MNTRALLTHLAVATALCGALVSGCAPTRPADPAAPATAQTEHARAQARVFAYQFPAGMVKGGVGNTLFATPVDGVVAIPDTPGPHPVVFLVHASLPGCTWAGHDVVIPHVNTVPWPQMCRGKPHRGHEGLADGHDWHRAPAGYAYLLQELARRGFAAVAIDVGAKEQLWGGEPDARQLQRELLMLHRGLIADLNADQGHGLAWANQAVGAFDLSRTALVGHSSGAGYAIQAATDGDLPGLAAIVSLQPAYNGADNARLGVPTLVVAGECDEQVGPKEPLTLARRLSQANPTTPIITASMGATTHIGVVAGGGTHRVGLVAPVKTAACTTERLAKPAAIQGEIAHITADFLQQAMAAQKHFELGVGGGMTLKVNALGVAVTVATRSVASLPATVDPRTVTFTESPEALLPKPWCPRTRMVTSDSQPGVETPAHGLKSR